MLRATWRRLGSPAWLTIGLIVLLPALAEAQLFPNRTIRRQKPSPVVEAPYHAQVRREYFGYYPTCWRKFPEGWQCPCPNPELPNAAASFAKEPLDRDRNPASGDPLGGPDDMPGEPGEGMPRPGPDDPNVPLPPAGRSPFDTETGPKPLGEPDPSMTPDPKVPPRNTVPPVNPPAGPTGLMEMPKLPSTSPTVSVEEVAEPGSMVMVPDATLASNPVNSRPDLGPLPSAPLPAPSTPITYGNAAEMQPVNGVPAPSPAQAPKRRGILSSLFNRNGTQNR